MLPGSKLAVLPDARTRAAGVRKGGGYGWKPSSSSNLSVRAFRAYPLVEIGQAAPCRAIRGNSTSVSSNPPPSWGYTAVSRSTNRRSENPRVETFGDFPSSGGGELHPSTTIICSQERLRMLKFNVDVRQISRVCFDVPGGISPLKDSWIGVCSARAPEILGPSATRVGRDRESTAKTTKSSEHHRIEAGPATKQQQRASPGVNGRSNRKQRAPPDPTYPLHVVDNELGSACGTLNLPLKPPVVVKS